MRCPMAVNLGSSSPATTSTGIVDRRRGGPRRRLLRPCRQCAGCARVRPQCCDAGARGRSGRRAASANSGGGEPLVEERVDADRLDAVGERSSSARRRSARSSASAIPAVRPDQHQALDLARGRRRAARERQPTAHRVPDVRARPGELHEWPHRASAKPERSSAAEAVAREVDEARASAPSGSACCNRRCAHRCQWWCVWVNPCRNTRRSRRAVIRTSQASLGVRRSLRRSAALVAAAGAPLTNVSGSWAPGIAHWPLMTNVGTAVMPWSAACSRSPATSERPPSPSRNVDDLRRGRSRPRRRSRRARRGRRCRARR